MDLEVKINESPYWAPRCHKVVATPATAWTKLRYVLVKPPQMCILVVTNLVRNPQFLTHSLEWQDPLVSEFSTVSRSYNLSNTVPHKLCRVEDSWESNIWNNEKLNYTLYSPFWKRSLGKCFTYIFLGCCVHITTGSSTVHISNMHK